MRTETNIFEFANYLTFLQDYAHNRKAKDPHWSYGSWARKMKVSGTSVITMLLKGDRVPADELQKKLANYFEFNDKEREYFFDLIRLTKIQHDPKLCVVLLEKMAKLHPTGNIKLLEKSEFDAISNWYYYAIREMLSLRDFREDPEWIARKLKGKVSVPQVKEAIEDLIKIGLLARDEYGILVSSVSTYETTKDISNEGLKRFHEQMIQNAKESIREVKVEDREISGVTLTIDKKNLHKAKELIRRFQDQFTQLMEEKVGESTYQLNMQFFPLTGGEECDKLQ